MNKQLKKIAFFTAFLGTVWGACLSATASPAYPTVNLNVRSGPGGQYRVIGVLAPEEGVTIQQCDGRGWCNITFRGRSGWAASRYLIEAQQGAVPEDTAVLEVIVDEVLNDDEPDVVIVRERDEPEIIIVEEPDENEIVVIDDDDDEVIIIDDEDEVIIIEED